MRQLPAGTIKRIWPDACVGYMGWIIQTGDLHREQRRVQRWIIQPNNPNDDAFTVVSHGPPEPPLYTHGPIFWLETFAEIEYEE